MCSVVPDLRVLGEDPCIFRSAHSANLSATSHPLKFTEQGERGSHHARDRDNVPGEVTEKVRRRTYTVEYKLQTVKEVQAREGQGRHRRAAST